MLRIDKQDGRCQVYVEGDMTIYNAAELKQAMQPVFDESGELDINLAGVPEIDSAGVQLLMLAKRERMARDRSLSLSDHSAAVLDVFELMGLVTWFNDPVVLPGDKGATHGH